MLALKAENYSGIDLKEMRQDWYRLAFDITHKYKLDEINAKSYEADIKNLLKLMDESANINMLKAVFKEVWGKTSAQNDKEKQLECQQVYEKIKKRFEK